MAISDNISKKALDIHKEFLDFQARRIADTPIARNVRELSTAAILQGNGSQAWIDYMQLFATTEQELDHLIPRDNTTADDLQKVRAYLVANGMCSVGTTRQLLNNVGNRLNV
ncbi:MAG TPA: hypothetical protein VN724_09595 [Pyrinomonadaceae bacterium]|jgi:hypothetical protein|nr:hypothetical protein [Pyrinomonadaceae bacterium]